MSYWHVSRGGRAALLLPPVSCCWSCSASGTLGLWQIDGDGRCRREPGICGKTRHERGVGSCLGASPWRGNLPAIVVDTYNADLRDAEGFVGESRRAFTALIEDWRERLRKSGQDDPLGDIPAEEFRKRKLDKVLLEGEPEAAALVHSAVEDFAQELAAVIRRFLRLKEGARMRLS